MSKKVLIVEDDKSIVDSLVLAFEKEGYEPIFAVDGAEGKNKFLEENPDVVILDLMLPQFRGEDVCRFIRSHAEIPVIVVSAKDSEIDRVVALELGADDYLTKPFSIRELLLRAEKLLKLKNPSTKIAVEIEGILNVGLFSLDSQKHEFKSDGKTVELTPREFAIVELLLKHPQKVWTRDELTSIIWGHDFVTHKSVDVYIKRLRQKLGTHGKKIKTVRGIGYKLEV